MLNNYISLFVFILGAAPMLRMHRRMSRRLPSAYWMVLQVIAVVPELIEQAMQTIRAILRYESHGPFKSAEKSGIRADGIIHGSVHDILYGGERCFLGSTAHAKWVASDMDAVLGCQEGWWKNSGFSGVSIKFSAVATDDVGYWEPGALDACQLAIHSTRDFGLFCQKMIKMYE